MINFNKSIIETHEFIQQIAVAPGLGNYSE